MTRTSFIEGGRQVATITIKNNGTTVKTFTEEKILTNGLMIDRYSTSAVAVELGTVVASELALRVDNSDGGFDSIRKGYEVEVKIGLEGSNERLAMGIFIITNITKHLDELYIEALDRMIMLDIPLDISTVTFPITARNLINVLCTVCGVQADFTETVPLINSQLKTPYIIDSLTVRQAIGYIAEVIGGVAFMLPSGKLAIRWYESKNLEINANVRMTSELAEEPLVIRSVKVDTEAFSNVTVDGNNVDLTITSNPFVMMLQDSEKQTLANSIYTNMTKGEMHNASATILPIPDLMPLEVVMWNGEKRVAITSTTFTLNGSMQILGKAEGSNEYNYAGTPNYITEKINEKSRVFTSQPTTPYYEGDLWFNSATSDIMTCINTRLTGNFTSNDWQKRNRYTEDLDFENSHTWNTQETIATFQGKVYKDEVDVTSNYPDQWFSWWLRNEDNVDERRIAVGKSCQVSSNDLGYGSTVIGIFTTYDSNLLTTKNGTYLTTKDGTRLFDYTEN